MKRRQSNDINGIVDTTAGCGTFARHSLERGSALVLALLIMAIMSLMGLAFALVAETENKISVNERHLAQALYVAEGGARLVKSWFDNPTSSGFHVPAVGEVDRTLRYVDPDGDGTFQSYSSASAPWDVIYRNGTDDLFEKPYRGDPAKSFEGTAANPDIRISDQGSSGEQAYLTSLNNALYPNFPSSKLRARIRQIDVYGAPIIDLSGHRNRFGIATVQVMVGVYENAGTAQEVRVGERVVKSVLNEIPYPGPLGPLQSGRGLTATGDFNVHWGNVTAVDNAELASNIDVKLNSGIPWAAIERMWQPDNGGDGTEDSWDTPNDGVTDFYEWFNASDDTIEDPWLKFRFGGTLTGVGALDDGSANNQPYDFSPGWANPSNPDPDAEHSNIFLHCDQDLFPVIDYNLWKNIALSGGNDIHYYTYDSASGKFKENGTFAAQTVQEATTGRYGLFFFDTTDGLAPHDNDGDGTSENLTPDVAISGGGWWSGGFIYMNSAHFKTTGLGNVPDRAMAAPGEPYIDTNDNGQLDSDEYFLNLDYPTAYIGNHYYDKRDWVTPGTATGGVSWDSRGPAIDQNIHFIGVLYTSGQWTAKGSGVYYGSVIAKEGVAEDTSAAAGTPDIFFDEDLVNGRWPPPYLEIPRTFVSSWETDM